MPATTRHQARWIRLGPDWMENGTVEMAAGRVAAVSKTRPSLPAQDHGSGVIMPTLINAHAHLGLSALAGLAHPGLDFICWVRELIRSRSTVTSDQSRETALAAARDAHDSGTGLVMEIGGPDPAREVLPAADLTGIIGVEFLGRIESPPELPPATPGLAYSFAGHALHTTDPRTLQTLKAAAGRLGQPFSLHLAEAPVETEFLATGHGPWADLLRERGIDFTEWELNGERPVGRANRLGLLGPSTLAVHCLTITPDEAASLAKSGTAVCVCPRSNLALHGRLPDLETLLSAGLTVALGTDSLASAPTLNMFDEMAFVAARYPGLNPETILNLATLHGARALGRPDLGWIGPGSAARLIYVDLDAASARTPAEALTGGTPRRVEWL